jgi:hypothetical protein
VVGSAAMSAVLAERPSVRISFRWLMAVVLGLALIAFVAGRWVYRTYGGYRPVALVHVPQTMRYRARVELGDAARVQAVQPLLVALDPRHVRVPALEQKLGAPLSSLVRELAFGVGPAPTDFVLVFGLQLPPERSSTLARTLCETLASDGIQSQPTETGCRLADGAIVANSLDGMLLIASQAELVRELLGRPDIGDRLGFSGPSVRGVAPKVEELGREAQQLAQLLGVRYP